MREYEDWREPNVEAPMEKPKLLEGEELIRTAYELGFYQPGRSLAEALEVYRQTTERSN